jgi:hypothetical protein
MAGVVCVGDASVSLRLLLFCLFFMAGVVYVGDASVSLRLLLLVSSSWLVSSMLEMQVSDVFCFLFSLSTHSKISLEWTQSKFTTKSQINGLLQGI